MSFKHEAAIDYPALSEEAVEQINAAIEIGRTLKKGPFRFELPSDVKRAMEVDPSGISAALMIHATARQAAAESTLSVADILSMAPQTAKMLSGVRQLIDLVAFPEIAEHISSFRDRIEESARGAGLYDLIKDTISDQCRLAYLRSSALYCIANFETHQFNQGAPSDRPFHFNEFVHEFLNVPSAVAATARQGLDGVSVVLIRDTSIGEYSFFCFVAKCGDTITLLTDREKFDNPDQKGMRRRPDRDLLRRIEASYFPYSLLDFQVREDDRLYVAADPEAERMLTHQLQAIRLKSLKEVDPMEATWALLMFDLISQKFWKRNVRTEQLSYTGEMITFPHALHASAHELTLTEYRPLELPSLELATIKTDAIGNAFRVKPTRFNVWMEERYGLLVDPAVFNQLKPLGEAPLLLGHTADGTIVTTASNFKPGAVGWSMDRDVTPYTAGHLPADSFGTRAQLAKQQLWTARRNLASAIQALADDEYNRERENVLHWIRCAVRLRLPALKQAIVAGEFLAPVIVGCGGFEIGGDTKVEMRNILKTCDTKDQYKEMGHSSREIRIAGERSRANEASFCFEFGSSVSTTIARFAIEGPQSLAAVLGCKVEDMPIFLQHWKKTRPYHGNNILDDVDPMESALRNPWINELTGWGIRPDVYMVFSGLAFRKWKRGDVSFIPPVEIDRSLLIRIKAAGTKYQIRHKKSREVSFVRQVGSDGGCFEVRLGGRTRQVSDGDILRSWEDADPRPVASHHPLPKISTEKPETAHSEP